MTLDANIVIKYLDGDETIIASVKQWRGAGVTLFLSSVAETEVLSFPKYTAAELKEVELFLEENFIPVPFDRVVARIAADLRRRTKIKFPDAAIAATALYTQTPLVTRNQRDFKQIPEIRIVVI